MTPQLFGYGLFQPTGGCLGWLGRDGTARAFGKCRSAIAASRVTAAASVPGRSAARRSPAPPAAFFFLFLRPPPAAPSSWAGPPAPHRPHHPSSVLWHSGSAAVTGNGASLKIFIVQSVSYMPVHAGHVGECPCQALSGAVSAAGDHLCSRGRRGRGRLGAAQLHVCTVGPAAQGHGRAGRWVRAEQAHRRCAAHEV